MEKNALWKIKEAKSTENVSINFDKDLIDILVERGYKTNEDIIRFLKPKLEYLNNESGFKDIDIACDRIAKAILKNERICIYGDYDVDGITSTSLLYLMLKKLGAKNLTYYIPLRDEGYGLSKSSIKDISDDKVDLIITVDCGITSYDEVYYCKALNIDIIITDHHSIIGNKLPEALAVVNPKREDNLYPFKELAGVGTIYMVLKHLQKKMKKKVNVDSFLDLVALGTISDLVPLVDDNRILVKYGLKKMVNSNILGIKKLVSKLEIIEDDEINSGDISFKIAPIFNAAGRLEDSKIVVKMLISENEKEIDLIINELINNNKNRKIIQEKITEEVVNEIESKDISKEYIIISHSENYHHGVIGIVASKILELYNRPTIIIEEKKDENIAVGSCRSRDGFDITKALSSVSDLLVKFGGHKGAAGFTIEINKIEEFKKRIKKYTQKTLNKDFFMKKYDVDKVITINKISYEFIKSLDMLKPFGMGNTTPVFVTKSLILEDYSLLGKEKKDHLCLNFKQNGFKIKKAMWFNSSPYEKNLKNEVVYDILYKLKISKYMGKYYMSTNIEDMKISKFDEQRFHVYKSLKNTVFPLRSVFYTKYSINKDDKLELKITLNKSNIYLNNQIISKLDDNIHNLLFILREYYGFKFKISISNLRKEKDHDIVYINIFKDYEIKLYSPKDTIAMKQIKKEIQFNIEYGIVYKKMLSTIFKDNKNIFVDINNLEIKQNEDNLFEIQQDFFDNFIKILSIFYKNRENEKLIYISNRKKVDESLRDNIILINDSLPKEIIEKEISNNLNEKKYYSYIIHFNKNFSKNEIKETLSILKNKINKKVKGIILTDNIENVKTILEVVDCENIKENIVISENLYNIKMSKQIENKDNVYVNWLPLKQKEEILEKLKNSLDIIIADNSILEYI